MGLHGTQVQEDVRQRGMAMVRGGRGDPASAPGATSPYVPTVG